MVFDQSLKEVLQVAGLSTIQSDFYLAILKSSGGTISKIAQDLNINRTNSYNIAEKLKKLDLIWEENRPSGKVLFARSSDHIQKLINSKEESLVDSKAKLKSISPILNSFIDTHNNNGPKIQIYSNKRGLEIIIEDILKEKDSDKEILLFSNQKAAKAFFTRKKHEEFIKLRIKRNIPIKVLAINNSEGKKLQEFDETSLRQTKLLSPDFNFDAEIYIYDNKISMIDIKEEVICVIIESEELCKIHKQMFMSLWY